MSTTSPRPPCNYVFVLRFSLSFPLHSRFFLFPCFYPLSFFFLLDQEASLRKHLMMQFKHVAICLVLLNYSDSTSVKRAKQMRVGKRSFPLDCVERWKVMVWWCLVMHRNAQIVTASQMSDHWTLLSLSSLCFLMLSALLLPASLLSTWLRAIFFSCLFFFIFLCFQSLIDLFMENPA